MAQEAEQLYIGGCLFKDREDNSVWVGAMIVPADSQKKAIEKSYLDASGSYPDRDFDIVSHSFTEVDNYTAAMITQNFLARAEREEEEFRLDEPFIMYNDLGFTPETFLKALKGEFKCQKQSLMDRIKLLIRQIFA